MTHVEREAIRREMKGKTYLYEVIFKVYGGGYGDSRGIILANNDAEAIGYAKRLFPYGYAIQKDHWGRGPWLSIETGKEIKLND
jgi:hypothetical protein